MTFSGGVEMEHWAKMGKLTFQPHQIWSFFVVSIFPILEITFQII